MNRALIITDNEILLKAFREIVKDIHPADWEFTYVCSTEGFSKNNPGTNVLNIKKSNLDYYKPYCLIISLHCKQLFPDWLANGFRCINIHPGLNPYNRGWYPQIFSIINGLPIGGTIHEIDTKLDHGNIIAQKEVTSWSWDNSYTLYLRVIKAEIELLRNNFMDILNNTYTTTPPAMEGNINLKAIFYN